MAVVRLTVSVCASEGGGRGQPRPGRLSRGRELCLQDRFGHNRRKVSRSVRMDSEKRHRVAFPCRGLQTCGSAERSAMASPWEPLTPLPAPRASCPAACVLQVVFSKYCNSSDIMDLFCIATGLPR